MTILIICLIAGILTIASQRWDDRERAKAAAVQAAELRETEARCRDEQAKQAAYVPHHEDDPRTAGKPVEPHGERRNRVKRAA